MIKSLAQVHIRLTGTQVLPFMPSLRFHSTQLVGGLSGCYSLLVFKYAKASSADYVALDVTG